MMLVGGGPGIMVLVDIVAALPIAVLVIKVAAASSPIVVLVELDGVSTLPAAVL